MAEEPDDFEPEPELVFYEPMPGFMLLAMDDPKRDIAIHAYALSLLHLPEGAMVTGWQKEFNDIVSALKDGEINARKPRAVS